MSREEVTDIVHRQPTDWFPVDTIVDVENRSLYLRAFFEYIDEAYYLSDRIQAFGGSLCILLQQITTTLR